MREIPRRRFIVPLLTMSSLLVSVAAARGDDRAEIETLKQQIQELKRADAERQRQLDEMMRLLRQLQPVQAKPGVPAPAAPVAGRAPASDREALDAAVSEAQSGSAPTAPSAGAIAAPAQPYRFPSVAGPLGQPGPTAIPGTLLYRPLPGQATLRLLEPSFDILMAGGGSTADDEELSTLQGGAHDPNQRGFTLQQGELSLFGAVDPYFTGETHIVFTPDGVELEEAFATTTRLPYDLQLEAGYFLTEFGRINPTHPHAWAWIDQPVINTRLFGGDGLRSPGATLSWLLPVPLFSELYLGIQNANEGEFTTSFLNGEAVGGRPGVDTSVHGMEDMLYLVRSATAWNMGDDMSALLGFSGLFGPNSTGDDARTFIYGADLTFKWRPADNFRGWPFVLWQSEVMKRDYTAEPFLAGTDVDDGGTGGHSHTAGLGTIRQHSHGDEGEGEGEGGEEEEFTENIPGALLRDWGFYTQLLYGFHHPWSAGIRAEWASGSGQSFPDGRMSDPFRADRLRISPLLIYQPSEFSRIRLQYNFDHAVNLDPEDQSTLWLGLEILFGTHAAHKY
jgi:hypothetical protein